MASRNQSEIDTLRQELVKLADITNDCEKSYENVLGALKRGDILPLAAQPLLQQHLETVNNMSVIKMVENRLSKIKSREIAVLVTGEFNAGKSTFVNILMGGQYLPMDRGKVTQVVCEIRHYSLRMAVLKFEDNTDDETMNLNENSTDETWRKLRQCIRTKEYNSEETKSIRQVERIIIYWPLEVMKDILGESSTIHDEIRTAVAEGPEQHDSLMGRESGGGGESREFPSEFLRRLGPGARSFTRKDQAKTPDPDHTNRKKVFSSNEHSQTENRRTSPGNKTGPCLPKIEPIDIRLPVDLNIVSSVELASESAPPSLPHQCEDILYKRNDHISKNKNTYNDRCETQDADMEQTDSEVKQVYEYEAESDQTDRKEIEDSRPEEPNVKQVTAFQFVFLDCPGIDLQDNGKDSPEYTGMIGEVERSLALIFVIDASKDTGVKNHGIKDLMQDIENNFRSRNMDMNPDQSLFVVNKADDVLEDTEKSEKLRKEVTQKLAESWPLTREDHVFLFQANIELEDCLRGGGGPLLRVQRFLLKSMRLTLEENSIWLLKMLEIAHSMAKIGQQSSGVVKKLRNSLETTKQDAMALQEEIKGLSDDHARRKAWGDLKTLLLQHDTDFQNIQWDINEIRERIPDDNNDWKEISESIHSLIGKKVEGQISSAAAKLKNEHTKKFDEIFKNVDEKIKKLQLCITGLEKMKMDDTHLNKGLFSLLAPAFISATVRAAPVVFLAVPILSIGLFGQLIVEDIRESRNESRRSDFKSQKVEFMRKETNRVLSIATTDLKGKGDMPESPLFKYFFGESKKKVLHEKTETVLQVVQILNEMTFDRSESSQKCCKKYITETMKFYVEKVMSHEFTKKDDIIWVFNEEGIRRTIEQGNNACTYEANISGRFGFKKSVAIKEFRCKLEPSDTSIGLPAEIDAYRECFYLRQLSSKHHTKLVNFLGTGTSITDGYLNLRIVMERYIGNFKRHVIASPRSASNEKHRVEFLHYAKECTEGLKFLHDNNVIHRDVKPSNYLIKEGTGNPAGYTTFYSVVISDIGCAKTEEANCTAGQERGSRAYWAPEISLANTFHSKSSDVFSLGLVLWEVWVRKLSYDENGRKRELMKVVEREGIPVIKNCLKTDPRARITAANLLKEFLALLPTQYFANTTKDEKNITL